MSDPSVIFYATLRYGGDFKSAHVFRLFRQIKKHAPAGAAFVVMSDAPHKILDNIPEDLDELLVLPLRHSWPGWWSKMEMFRTLPGVPAIFMDLDTSIVADLAPVIEAAKRHKFIILEDFYRGAGTMQSSVMSWADNTFASRLYASFKTKAAAYMDRFSSDQTFIEAALEGQPVARWQDILPGAFVSYKADNIAENGLPEGAIVVIFHGKPRPWDHGVKNVD